MSKTASWLTVLMLTIATAGFGATGSSAMEMTRNFARGSTGTSEPSGATGIVAGVSEVALAGSASSIPSSSTVRSPNSNSRKRQKRRLVHSQRVQRKQLRHTHHQQRRTLRRAGAGKPARKTLRKTQHTEKRQMRTQQKSQKRALKRKH